MLHVTLQLQVIARALAFAKKCVAIAEMCWRTWPTTADSLGTASDYKRIVNIVRFRLQVSTSSTTGVHTVLYM